MTLTVDLDLNDKLRLELFKLEESLIEIEVLKDIPAISFMGVTIPRAKSRTKIQVPQYLANFLIQRDEAKLVNNDIYITLIDALKDQKPSFKLKSMIDESLIRALISIGISSTEEPVPLFKNLNELTQTKNTLSNLFTERMKRILRDLAIVDYNAVEKDLQLVERPLIHVISNYIKTYYDFISNNKVT